MDTNKITDPLNRGMVAGILGMPADMVNMLRNAGRSVQNLTLMAQNKPTIPMQQDPAYGQEWWGNKMQQMGYVTPKRNPVAEFGAGLLDPTGIADTLAAKAPMLAQGLFNLGDPALATVTKGLLAKKAYDVAPDVARAAAKNLSAPATLNKPGFAGQRGAIVWHGSPHTFDAFDASKIGTGEGAQAYGHGLYFAESQDVANSYLKASNGPGATRPDWAYISIDGVPLEAVTRGMEPSVAGHIASVLTASGGNVQQAAKAFRTMAAGSESSPVVKNVMSVLERAKSADLSKIPSGSLYKVDLPDDAISKMLDWDKPLSQQAPAVRAAVQRTRAMLPPNAVDDLGGDLSLLYGRDVGADSFLGTMNSLQPNLGETLLRRAGVPGVRYLDGGSRGTGAGTSNFVVFPGNEGLLKILERNGKPLK